MNTDQFHHTSAPPVRRLWLSVFLAYLAFGGTLQLLPPSLESRFQSNAAFIGLAVGIAFAATAVWRPFAGWAGDAGAGKPVVVLGGVLTLAGVLGQALAVDECHVLVARVVMGSGEAAVFSAALPWVLRGVPAESAKQHLRPLRHVDVVRPLPRPAPRWRARFQRRDRRPGSRWRLRARECPRGRRHSDLGAGRAAGFPAAIALATSVSGRPL